MLCVTTGKGSLSMKDVHRPQLVPQKHGHGAGEFLVNFMLDLHLVSKTTNILLHVLCDACWTLVQATYPVHSLQTACGGSPE